MSKIGYKFHKKFAQQVFFAKGPDERRTHYVHVRRYKGAKWEADILFRDYLRNHRQRARKYSLLKIKLAKKYANDRGKYTKGKDVFIRATLRLARQ